MNIDDTLRYAVMAVCLFGIAMILLVAWPRFVAWLKDCPLWKR
jgi:hypothetical protein